MTSTTTGTRRGAGGGGGPPRRGGAAGGRGGARVTAESWWDDRIAGAFMSYWLYQHLGNLSVAELHEEPLLARVRDAGDGTEILRDFARHADREPDGSRWSFRRDLGATRVVMLDSRAGRVVTPDRPRDMLGDDEWAW